MRPLDSLSFGPYSKLDLFAASIAYASLAAIFLFVAFVQLEERRRWGVVFATFWALIFLYLSYRLAQAAS